MDINIIFTFYVYSIATYIGVNILRKFNRRQQFLIISFNSNV